jgi:hypothetical protein
MPMGMQKAMPMGMQRAMPMARPLSAQRGRTGYHPLPPLLYRGDAVGLVAAPARRLVGFRLRKVGDAMRPTVWLVAQSMAHPVV